MTVYLLSNWWWIFSWLIVVIVVLVVTLVVVVVVKVIVIVVLVWLLSCRCFCRFCLRCCCLCRWFFCCCCRLCRWRWCGRCCGLFRCCRRGVVFLLLHSCGCCERCVVFFFVFLPNIVFVFVVVVVVVFVSQRCERWEMGCATTRELWTRCRFVLCEWFFGLLRETLWDGENATPQLIWK